VSCPADSRCKSVQFFQDGVGGGGPSERFAAPVVTGDEVIDLADQILHACKRATSNRLVPRLAFGHDTTVEDIQGGEQRRGTVAL